MATRIFTAIPRMAGRSAKRLGNTARKAGQRAGKAGKRAAAKGRTMGKRAATKGRKMGRRINPRRLNRSRTKKKLGRRKGKQTTRRSGSRSRSRDRGGYEKTARARDKRKRQGERASKTYDQRKASSDRAERRQAEKGQLSERSRSRSRSRDTNARSRSRSREQSGRERSRSRSRDQGGRERDRYRSQNLEREGGAQPSEEGAPMMQQREGRDGAPSRDRYREKRDRTRRRYRQRQRGLRYPVGRRGTTAVFLATSPVVGVFPQNNFAGFSQPIYPWTRPSQVASIPSPYPSSSMPPPLYGGGSGGSDGSDGSGGSGLSPDPEPDMDAPFSAPELQSMATHNAIPHRTVRSLEVVEGPVLQAFMEARDDYLMEKNPKLQKAKAIRFIKMAEHIDERFHTHADGWIKIMRNRPKEWSKIYTARYADTIDATEMAKIAAMPEPELSKYLVSPDAATIPSVDPYYDPTFNGGLDADEEVASSISTGRAGVIAEPIGCDLDALTSTRTPSAARSVPNDRFCIYYRWARKALVFHLNGLVEGYSFTTEERARRGQITEVVRVLDQPFFHKNLVETRCTHMRLISQARNINSLLKVLPANAVGVQSLEDIGEAVLTSVDARFGFSNDFSTGTYYALKKVPGANAFNAAVDAIAEIALANTSTLEKMFPGVRVRKP